MANKKCSLRVYGSHGLFNRAQLWQSSSLNHIHRLHQGGLRRDGAAPRHSFLTLQAKDTRSSRLAYSSPGCPVPSRISPGLPGRVGSDKLWLILLEFLPGS